MAVAEKFKSSLLTRYDVYAIVYLFIELDFRMSLTWITLRLNPGPVNLRLFNVGVSTDLITNFIKSSKVKTCTRCWNLDVIEQA